MVSAWAGAAALASVLALVPNLAERNVEVDRFRHLFFSLLKSASCFD